jgi:hypothetical protein
VISNLLKGSTTCFLKVLLVASLVLFHITPSIAYGQDKPRQTLRINEDWIFKIRATLQLEHVSDGLRVSSDDLRLSVLDSYKNAPVTVNYVTIDLVNRTPGQKGWNTVSTTKGIPVGSFNVRMNNGDSLGATFSELIPNIVSDSFDFQNHWLVLTVHITTARGRGTVHAHTPERLASPVNKVNTGIMLGNGQHTDGDTTPTRFSYDGGAFERLSGQALPIWVESKTKSDRKFQFFEKQRTVEWLTLFDASRSMTIRLPLAGGLSQFSMDGGLTWTSLYKVTPFPESYPVTAEKNVMFVTKPNVKWSVTSTAKGRIWTDGPFLRVALDEHTMRVDPRYVKTATKLVGVKVEITKTEDNGVWRTIRSSDLVELNTTLFRDDVRKIPPNDFRIPIEGIPLNELANHGLVLTTIVGDTGGRTYSHSPSRIGQLKIN